MNTSFPRGDIIAASGYHDNASNPKRPFSNIEEQLFGNKRTKRIEVVSSKKSTKTKSSFVNTTTLADAKEAIGLGMTKSVANNKIIKIEPLTFLKINPGSLLVGYVLQVLDEKLLVSVAGGFTGYVPITEVSDNLHRMASEKIQLPALASLVSPFQFLRLCVIDKAAKESNSNRKMLVLSARSSLVNKGIALKHFTPGFPILGSVSSIEDHGYIISAGIGGINFFLPIKTAPSELIVGQPVECVTVSVNEGSRTVILRGQTKVVIESVTRGSLLTFQSLNVGMLMNATVEKIVENGLIVSFLGVFHGVIDTLSLSRPYYGNEWSKLFTVGDVIQARIIFIDHGSKSVRLSCKPHILDMRACIHRPQLGSFINNLEVLQVNSNGNNVLLTPLVDKVSEKDDDQTLKIVDEDNNPIDTKRAIIQEIKRKRKEDESVLSILVSKQNLSSLVDVSSIVASDPSEDYYIESDAISKLYSPHKVLPCIKVIGYSLVDGYVVGSNLPNLIRYQINLLNPLIKEDGKQKKQTKVQPTEIVPYVSHHSEIKLGSVYEVEVSAINDANIIVLINKKIHASCPFFHLDSVVLSDNKIRNLLKKKYAVGSKMNMRVWELNPTSIVMTHKKLLLDLTEDSILTSYDEATVSNSYCGVISKIHPVKGIVIHFFNRVQGMIPMSILVKQGVFDPHESYQLGQVIRVVVLENSPYIGKEQDLADDPLEPAVKSKKNQKPYNRLMLCLDLGNSVDELIKLLPHNYTARFADDVSKISAINNDNQSVVSHISQASTHASHVTFTTTKTSASSIITEKMPYHNIEFVSGTIFKIDKAEGLYFVRLEDNRIAKLHKHHLFDLAVTGELIMDNPTANLSKLKLSYNVGDRVENAMVISSQSNSNFVTISLKPLLLCSAKMMNQQHDKNPSSSILDNDDLSLNLSIPNKVNDLSPGQIIVGVVSRVENFGIFVKFRDSFSALAARPSIADRFIQSAVGLFTIGDSIRCIVQRVDLVNERAILTCKPSIVPASTGAINYLSSYLQESYIQASIKIASTNKIMPNWNRFSLSSTIDATVASIEDYGIVFIADDNTTIMVAPNSSNSVNVDDVVQIRIMDLNFEHYYLDVMMLNNQNISKKNKKNKKAKGEKSSSDDQLQIMLGEHHSAKICLIREKYLVVLIGNQIGYVMVADFHSPKPDMSEFIVDQTIQVKVIQTAENTKENAAYPHSTVMLLALALDQTHKKRQQVLKLQQEVIDSDRKLHERLSGEQSTNESNNSAHLRQRFLDTLRVGHLSNWLITDVSALELTVLPEFHEVLGLKVKAVIHISNAINPYDGNDCLEDSLRHHRSTSDVIHADHPFYGLKSGTKVWCHVLQVRRQSVKDSHSNELAVEEFIVYLSLALKNQSITDEIIDEHDHATKSHDIKQRYLPYYRLPQAHGKDELKCPSVIAVVVTKISATGLHVSISPYLSSFIPFIDVSSSPSIIRVCQKNCFIGQRLIAMVRSIIKDGNRVQKIILSRAVLEQHFDNNIFKDITKINKSFLQENIPKVPKLTIGQKLYGLLNLQIQKIKNPPAIAITLANNITGRVCVTELSDVEDWVDFSTHFAVEHDNREVLASTNRRNGELVEVIVLHVNNEEVELSMRPSRQQVLSKEVEIICQADPIPEEGSIVQGYVINTSTKGCFLRLTSDVTGHVLMKELCDDFVEDPATAYPMGKLVTAKVLSINHNNNSLKLTMKMSSIVKLSKDSADSQAISNMSVGDTISGTVQQVNDIGVFININNTTLVGLARKNAANLNPSKNLKDEYEIGDVVKAKILSISKSSFKIGLGLKEHYFKSDDMNENVDIKNFADDEDDNEDKDDEDEDEDEEEEEEDSDDDIEKLAFIKEVDSDDDDDDDEKIEDIISRKRKVDSNEKESNNLKTVNNIKNKKIKENHSLIIENDDEDDDAMIEDDNIFSAAIVKPSIDYGFETDTLLQWEDFKPAVLKNEKGVGDDNLSDDDNSEEELPQIGDNHNSTKKRSRQKEAIARKQEELIRQREAALVDGTLIPEIQDDFERLVISQPNSSFVWIQYMAFHLQTADIENARIIATRSLRSIGFREEEEKFNVWVAILNMEHKFGTMETLDNMFNKAVAESKSKYIYLAMADTYEKAGDIPGAMAIFNKALKRPQFKKSKKIWIAFHSFLIRANDIIGAKQQLSRSMQSLSRHKHVEVITRYALSEYDNGSIDRARVLFEELLSSYPKRTDLIHLYVDREIKQGNIQHARQLFNRVVHQTLPYGERHLKWGIPPECVKPDKQRVGVFLLFEESYGDETSQNMVKSKARDYVEK
eukprot:gene5669-7826_t